MKPILPLVRLPHSHIDPNWLSGMEAWGNPGTAGRSRIL
jgi:hypothetical protein